MPDSLGVELPSQKPTCFMWRKRTLRFLLFVTLTASRLRADQLKPEAEAGWKRYVALTEARIDREQADLSYFLWIDTIPEQEKERVEAQLGKGQVVIERLTTTDPDGSPIKTRGALVHHWIGTAYIPGATMQQAVALVQDYNHHYKTYKPEVERSQLISRNGDDFQIYLRYRKKKIITVVLNTYHDVHYVMVDADRARCRSYTTKVREVEDAGTAREHERSSDDQYGFMWSMNTYWRFENRNGGVYLQCEAITLTRSIPVALRWLIEPYITSFPRESLTETMNQTRDSLAATSSPPQP
ncbi:MAG TPA: hypothetical protein VKH18_05020 [Terriglobales bacterium]|nr:hypothetical protein [Terriglobales bacterium]